MIYFDNKSHFKKDFDEKLKKLKNKALFRINQSFKVNRIDEEIYTHCDINLLSDTSTRF